MTRPGPSPSRGRHAAPDDDARPEDRPAGRHAAPDPPRSRHAVPDDDAYYSRAGGAHVRPDEPYGGQADAPSADGGRHAAGLNGHGANGGYGRHLAELPPAGWAGEQAQPWRPVNGYHLDAPAPPAVNGYRLDEPVAPVNGFPYSAPPSTPIAYPVNGHGVDAAEREAASWPVDGFHPAELDRPPLDPQIAVVPLHDEPTETLARPTTPEPDRRAGTSSAPTHPPRAVVRRRQARRKALEWPLLIVFALVSAFLIRQYVVQTFYIPSGSMHETLIEGDRVLVNKVGYHLHDIHRGDIVVFSKPPNLEVSEDDLIKRVVALPGETVEGRGGKVYVNGAPLDEPYVEPLCHGTAEFPRITVPAGKLWVMGDNRCNSSDSRVFGPIGQDLVVGRAFVLAWPFDRLSWL